MMAMLPGKMGWAAGVGERGSGGLVSQQHQGPQKIQGLEVLEAGLAQTHLDPTVFCHSGSKLSGDDEEFNCCSR